MSERLTILLLDDIWEALEKVGRYTAGLSHDHFLHDEKTVDAVVRNLEIIGEASNRLPDELKANHNDVEWHKIVGLRNRIVHRYFGLDLEIIWTILEKDLPAFRSAIDRIRAGRRGP
ncbi:MAG: hypothetical protein A3K19_24655 [Lentisphaerae bacterium RIFOXYB12_FULL_65_16]|nr:MAG: hypothetical protein A3K18_17305 [Lentisphaerae bacterium RIFOXYA12_64_32]OGV84012.1 MAG: hypothetical protein A3K19_24655 [Lentisphaerae bacterium RIFOXYB12_FULL_65_16]